MMFLDWQLSRYGSPVCDLFYYLFSATDQSFRQKYFNDLLLLYHSTLSDNIKELGSDPDKLYSLERFQEDSVKFGRFPLIFMPLLIQFCHIDHRFISDLDDFCEKICNGEQVTLFKQFDDVTESMFKRILNETVTDIVTFCKIE